MAQSVSEFVWNRLHEWGVRRIFGYPGDGINGLIGALDDPEKMPLGTPYSSVIESDVPVIVQHTRLDSRAAEIALLSTIAYPVE